MTEEIFPGYRFTEFSYVVSLLRPEIIRDLELPRHGLKILPLPSTVTPMDNGDYLAALGRPRPDAPRDLSSLAARCRSLRRIRPRDGARREGDQADASAWCRPIRRRCSLRDLLGLLKLGQYAQEPVAKRSSTGSPSCVTQSSADLLERVVRVRSAEGHEVRQRHHRHVPRPAFAGHGVRAAASLHGRDRRRVPRLGLRQERHRRRHGGDRAVGARARRGDPHRARPCSRSSSRAAAPRASRWRTATSCTRRSCMSAADPKRSFLQFVEGKHFPDEFVQQIKNFRVRGSSGKVNIALSELPDFTCLPGEGPLHRGAISISPSIDYIERAYDEAKYGQFSKNPYIDMIIPSMIDRDMAPPGPPRDVVLRAVRAVRYRRRLGRCEARRVRRNGHLDHRALRAEHPHAHRRQAGDHAEGHRDASPASPAATSSTANCCCTNCSSCAPRRNGPISARRCQAITSARPARIRAAASWARPASWRRRKC